MRVEDNELPLTYPGVEIPYTDEVVGSPARGCPWEDGLARLTPTRSRRSDDLRRSYGLCRSTGPPGCEDLPTPTTPRSCEADPRRAWHSVPSGARVSISS